MKIYLFLLVFLITLLSCENRYSSHESYLTEYGSIVKSKKCSKCLILKVGVQNEIDLHRLIIEIIFLDSALNHSGTNFVEGFKSLVISDKDTLSLTDYDFLLSKKYQLISNEYPDLYFYIVDSLEENYFEIFRQNDGTLMSMFDELKDSKYKRSSEQLIYNIILRKCVLSRDYEIEVLKDLYILNRIAYLDCKVNESCLNEREKTLSKSLKLIKLVLHSCANIHADEMEVKDHSYADSLNVKKFSEFFQ